MRQICAVPVLLLLKEDRLFRAAFQENLEQALTKMPVILTEHVLHLQLLPEVPVSVLINRLVLPVRGFRPLAHDGDFALALRRCNIPTLLPIPVPVGLLLDRFIFMRDQERVILGTC